MGWALRDLTPCPDVPLTLRNMTWGPWARPRDTLRSQVGTALLPRAPHLVKLLWMCTFATPLANIKLDITVPPSSGQTASQTTFTRPYSACSWCFLQLAHMSDLILQCSTVWVKCWNPKASFIIASLALLHKFSQFLFLRTSPILLGNQDWQGEVAITVGVGFLP